MVWDKLSPFYDFFEAAYNGKVFRGIAAEIANYVGAGDEVLECACGTGLLSVPMAQKCKRLVASDFSDGMLKRVRKKLRKFPNASVEKLDILDLPFAEGSFDVVVAANVVHLLDDPRSALNGLARVCKTGGKIVVPTYINRQRKGSMLAASLLAKTGVEFKRQFDFESYQKFFAELGFGGAEYKTVEGRMPCCFALIRK